MGASRGTTRNSDAGLRFATATFAVWSDLAGTVAAVGAAEGLEPVGGGRRGGWRRQALVAVTRLSVCWSRSRWAASACLWARSLQPGERRAS